MICRTEYHTENGRTTVDRGKEKKKPCRRSRCQDIIQVPASPVEQPVEETKEETDVN